MTVKTRDWTETGRDGMADVAGRALFVSDGTVGHYTALGGGEAVGQALAEYAAGYDCDPQEVVVDWHLFEGGEEVDCGRYTFAA